MRRYGKREHCTDDTFFTTRKGDVPPTDHRTDIDAELQSVVLVADGRVVAVYRNRWAHHQIRKRGKYARARAA